jgi:hypothetical protein
MVNPFEEILSELKEVKERLASMPQAAAPDSPEIITDEQLCVRLGVCRQTTTRLREKKRIPFFTVGTAIRYDFKKVIAALEARKK